MLTSLFFATCQHVMQMRTNRKTTGHYPHADLALPTTFLLLASYFSLLTTFPTDLTHFLGRMHLRRGSGREHPRRLSRPAPALAHICPAALARARAACGVCIRARVHSRGHRPAR
eukprot:scaffold17203_cov55-Phaeocystis_antarctica.AAC.7